MPAALWRESVAPPKHVATSTRDTGTVSRRLITALATHFGSGRPPPADSPLIISGAASQGFGEDGPALALAALIHAAGDRRDVLLRASGTDGDRILIAASRRLGWMRPEISESAITATPLSHRGVALFRAGLGNTVTLDRAAAMAQARIQVACWCDKCGPVPLTAPCGEHSLTSVKAAWQAKTWGTRAAA